MQRNVMEMYLGLTQESSPSSEGLFAFYAVAPLAELPEQLLVDTVTGADLKWLTFDRHNTCKDYDEHAMDVADHTLVQIACDGVDPGIEIVFQTTPVEVGLPDHSEDCPVYWSAIWREEYGDCSCNRTCERNVARKERRNANLATPRPQREVFAGLNAIIEPHDESFIVEHVMGADSNGRTQTVSWFSDSGLTDSQAFNPVLSDGCIYIAPVLRGNRGGKFGWFGRSYKSVGLRKPTRNHFTTNLGSVVEAVQHAVASEVYPDIVQRCAIRPLGRTIVAPGNRGVTADVWPITDKVALAVAIPNSQSSGGAVRRLTHWSSGNLGSCSSGKINLGPTLVRMIISAPQHRKGNRHADFLLKGAPEPVVRMTGPTLDRICSLAVRRTFEEETTLIVLEGVRD